MRRIRCTTTSWCVLGGLIALVGGCTEATESRAAAAYTVEGDRVSIAKEGPVRFDLAKVELGPAPALPAVPARVTTVDALTSPSFAPLSGRVVEVKVRLGDQVQKGQKLALVRTADLPTLEHELRAAEVSVAARAAAVERLKALVEARAGSENELLLAESELEQARLLVKAAKAKLASLSVSRADETTYWVLATRSGTVVELDATPGLQVGPDRGSPIATVADLSEVLVVGDVPPQYASHLHPGASARIALSASAGDVLEGRIEVVSDVVDPERQTVPVRVRVDNSARTLRPNAFVDLTFSVHETKNTVLVPAVSVVRDGSNAVVFVATDKGVFEKRTVVLGRQGREVVEVLSGVKPGESVVKTGALLLLNALDIEA